MNSFQNYQRKRKKTLDINIVSISENIQEQVTGIMGASPKLWVIIENLNSARAGEAPAALKNTVLELLKKLLCQSVKCNNTITYKRLKNALLGVTGTSSCRLPRCRRRRHCSFKNTISISLKKILPITLQKPSKLKSNRQRQKQKSSD